MNDHEMETEALDRAERREVNLRMAAEAEDAEWERKAEAEYAAHQAETEACEVARLAVHIPPYMLGGGMVYPGTAEGERLQVEAARRILAEARRQVAADQGSA